MPDIKMSKRLQHTLDRAIALMQADGTEAQIAEAKDCQQLLVAHFLPLIKELCSAGVFSMSLDVPQTQTPEPTEHAHCWGSITAHRFGPSNEKILLVGLADDVQMPPSQPGYTN